MDPSNVLLVLEEQKKWRERLKRIQEQIRQLEHRKATLTKELDRVHRKLKEWGNRISADLRDTSFDRTPSPPINPWR